MAELTAQLRASDGVTKMSVFNDEQLAEIKQITAAAVKAAMDGLKADHKTVTDGLKADHSQLRADFESTQNKGGVTADDTNSLDNGTQDNQAFHRKDLPQRGVRA